MKQDANDSKESPWMGLARQLRGWADTLISTAGHATDLGLSLTQAKVQDPKKKAAIGKAGEQLRRWREGAGLTLDELSQAVGLKDSQLIAQAEGGLVHLPFEVVLRLAAVLGRHDPILVALSLTKQYNPKLWDSLDSMGVSKLVMQGARERELANIYRASDAARQLNDERFAQVLAFTQQAFNMAVQFAGEAQPPAKAKAADAKTGKASTDQAPKGKAAASARESARVSTRSKAASSTSSQKPSRSRRASHDS